MKSLIFNKKFLVIVSSIFITAFLFFWTVGVVWGSISFKVPTEGSTYTNYTFFNATTTTATSTNTTDGGQYFVIAGAKRVALFFSRGGVTQPNTGSTLFKIEVSRDGTTFYPYNVLVQNLATSTTPTVVSTVTIGAATTTVVAWMRDLGFYAIRCVAIETTDGEHTCAASADF